MPVTATADGTLVTLHVEGAIDSHLGTTLLDATSTALDGGARRLLVNLQKTKQANSVGLKALVDVAQRVTGQGGRIALVGPTPHLLDILKATRLERRFAVFDSTEQAIKSLRLEA